MKKKGAIGLSVNLLVVIIISFVILSGGILFLKSLISGAEQIKSSLDTKTEEEIKNMLLSGNDKIIMPRRTATISRGEDCLFGLGILNIDGQTFSDFRVKVSLDGAYDSQKKPLVLSPEQITQINTKWLFYIPTPPPIRENQPFSQSILIQVPKEAGVSQGNYIFKTEVSCTCRQTTDPRQPQTHTLCQDDHLCEPYGNILLFTVIVK